jgi:thiamine-phosphate pyrophosphorylase
VSPLGFGIYAVTDPNLCRPDLIGSVREAIEGGAGAIQLRDKTATAAELYRLAEALRRLTSDLGALLVVNDRIDVALAVAADGVHVGQGDIPARLARGNWPRPRLLGVSAATEALARVAELDGADYVGAGPVFETATKQTGRSPLGPEGLRRIVDAVRIPVVGIGGITIGNVATVAGTGAAAAAVIAGLFADPAGPRAAAAQLQQAFRLNAPDSGAGRRRPGPGRARLAGGSP